MEMQFCDVEQKSLIYEWLKYNNVELLCILKFSKQCYKLTFVDIYYTVWKTLVLYGKNVNMVFIKRKIN